MVGTAVYVITVVAPLRSTLNFNVLTLARSAAISWSE
jgi:hypothetical protein